MWDFLCHFLMIMHGIYRNVGRISLEGKEVAWRVATGGEGRSGRIM